MEARSITRTILSVIHDGLVLRLLRTLWMRSNSENPLALAGTATTGGGEMTRVADRSGAGAGGGDDDLIVSK